MASKIRDFQTIHPWCCNSSEQCNDQQIQNTNFLNEKSASFMIPEQHNAIICYW